MGIFGLICLAAETGRIVADGHVVRRPGEIALQFHLGLALVAPLLMVIGSISLTAAAMFVSFVGVAAGLYAIYRIMEAKPVELPRGQRFGFIEWASIVTIAALALLTAISAMAPATSWDAATAHLAVPAAYVSAGHISLIPGNVYSAYPQLIHSLIAATTDPRFSHSDSMLTWFLTCMSAAAVFALAHRLQGRTAGLIAAAIFLSAPIVIAQAGTVGIDVPFAGLVASGLLALLLWDEERSLRHLIIAGVIAGAACGVRHTGYFVALFMLIWVAVDAKSDRARSAATFAVCAVVASAPWWLRSWILVGNPVYPMLTSVFGDGSMPDVQVTAPFLHETTRDAGLLDAVLFPLRIVMSPGQFDGWQASPGGLVLALGVVGVVIGGRRARWLGGFALAGTVAIYTVQRFARYLFPFLTPLYAAAALAAVRPGPLRRPIAGLLLFTYIYGVGLAIGMTYFKWPVVFGGESREHYLTRRVERYPAFVWINSNTPKDAVILTLDPRSYYLDRLSFQNLAAVAQLIGKSIDAQVEWMQSHKIRYILVPEAYVASSPIFRERGIVTLLEAWRGDARFRTVYSEDVSNPRGGVEHVTILEVAGGDGSGTA